MKRSLIIISSFKSLLFETKENGDFILDIRRDTLSDLKIIVGDLELMNLMRYLKGILHFKGTK